MHAGMTGLAAGTPATSPPLLDFFNSILYDTMNIEIEVYEDASGARPFDRWFDHLPAAHAAKVTTAMIRIAGGARSGLKAVGSGVSEWKIEWGPGLRIYLAFDGARLVILLGGGTKARQQDDIKEALQRWAEYKRRKAGKE